ncbi:MAG: hypothetical protein OXF93_17925 [Acidobacteria bacterium]|nr:hypothetical protein [Acidobacteriota bacterium]
MPAPIVARRASVLGLMALLACAMPTVAAAQMEEPIGLYAFDLRGSFVPFTRNADLAGRFGFTPPETPGPGWGFDAGAHLYPLRWRGITFGVGAGFHSSFADQDRSEPAPDPEDEPLALPSVRKRFTSVSSQVSLNFGNRNGWSYLSVGLGRSQLGLRALDDEGGDEAAPLTGVHTLSYGGGARWFNRPHLAFSLDARFYALRAPRMTVVVISIGASFK